MFRQHVEQHYDLGDAAVTQKISKIMQNRKNFSLWFLFSGKQHKKYTYRQNKEVVRLSQ